MYYNAGSALVAKTDALPTPELTARGLATSLYWESPGNMCSQSTPVRSLTWLKHYRPPVCHWQLATL